MYTLPLGLRPIFFFPSFRVSEKEKKDIEYIRASAGGPRDVSVITYST